jgi:hypothetical protein
MLVQNLVHHNAEVSRLVGALLRSLLLQSDGIDHLLAPSFLLRRIREVANDFLQRIPGRQLP